MIVQFSLVIAVYTFMASCFMTQGIGCRPEAAAASPLVLSSLLYLPFFLSTYTVHTIDPLFSLLVAVTIVVLCHTIADKWLPIKIALDTQKTSTPFACAFLIGAAKFLCNRCMDFFSINEMKFFIE